MAFLEGVHRGEIDKGLAAAEQIRSRASKKKQKQQLSHKRPRPVFAAEKEQQTKHQLQQKVAKLTWDNNVLRQKQQQLQKENERLELQVGEYKKELAKREGALGGLHWPPWSPLSPLSPHRPPWALGPI